MAQLVVMYKTPQAARQLRRAKKRMLGARLTCASETDRRCPRRVSILKIEQGARL
jgi:hypothetical protein